MTQVSLEVVNFEREMKRIEDEIVALGNIEIAALVEYGTQQLRVVTPVDTGNARRGWQRDIEVSFTRIDPKAPMSFTGVNGDIEITLPANSKFSARMKTDWGDIYTNFDMTIDRSPAKNEVSTKKGQYKVSVNKWVYGTVNGGGPEYLFKTLHGDISIRKN